MVTRTDAIAIHEAAYALRARAIGIPARPPELNKGLRRYFCGVIDFDLDDLSSEFCTKTAIVLLGGDAALEAMAPSYRGDTRDEMEARDVLYLGFRRRKAGNLHIPSLYREFHNTVAELRFQAAEFVLENRAEIIATAEQLSDTAGKSRPKSPLKTPAK